MVIISQQIAVNKIKGLLASIPLEWKFVILSNFAFIGSYALFYLLSYSINHSHNDAGVGAGFLWAVTFFLLNFPSILLAVFISGQNERALLVLVFLLANVQWYLIGLAYKSRRAKVKRSNCKMVPSTEGTG